MSSFNRIINVYDSDDENVDTAVLEFERALNRSFENDLADIRKPSFPILFTPISDSNTSASEDQHFLECHICLESRPQHHFHLFECGHGVCKVEKNCKNYDFDHCVICKRPRNIEDEVAKFSAFEEEEKQKASEKMFQDEMQKVLELSMASMKEDCSVPLIDEKKYEDDLKSAIILSMRCENNQVTEYYDEGYVSSDSTITDKDDKEEEDGYLSEGSSVTLDETASIETMIDWNVLVPRKRQRRV